MFTKLYLDTTNPKLQISELFKSTIMIPLLISVIFHTVLYTLFCNMVSFIFFGKLLSGKVNKRLLLFLFPIMLYGYYARFFHVKEIYNAYNRDMIKTRKHLDNLYISWIFIA
jgi:hypothetical protein